MMTNALPIKSYQNCTENDVVGYNDCPESLFVLSTAKSKRARPRRIPVGIHGAAETNYITSTGSSGSASDSRSSSSPLDDDEKLRLPKARVAKRTVVPPPPIGRRSTSSSLVSSSSSIMDIPCATSRSSSMRSVDEVVISEEELLKKVSNIIQTDSKLVDKELEYYKKKVDSYIEPSLKNYTVKLLLSHFFNELETSKDREQAQKLLVRAITSDTTISSWCPAFLKIFENANL
ncbi:Alpha1-proteinase inhibitor-degradation deficient protein 37 [Nakaseomyces bracarensis]|uniref:Alpha1-proteinase inhibitor-degradation deficient protein 37 n=1 Tax=Nakaseomyces bracarensis TaxID=273131 RepID=A0ABR4NPC1_9SACH